MSSKPMSMNEENKCGFVATLLVVSMMIMMSLGSLGAFSAAESYDDAVLRRQYRLDASLDARSCVSVALLAFAHDYFYAATDQSVPDFSCTIVFAARNGQDISVQAQGRENGVVEEASAEAEDTGRSIILL